MELSLNPSIEKKIEELYQKLNKGDEVLKTQKSQEGIFTLGLTGAGKSTLTSLIINSNLKVIRNKGRIIIQNVDPHALVKIGQTTKSCTDIPNHVQFEVDGEKYNIFDCPGFLDVNKFDSVIANSYYVYQLFSNIRKIKFLLVIDESTITSNHAKQFIKSVCCFLNLFKFDKNFTEEQLAKHCVLTITKASIDLESITSQIQQIIGEEFPIQDDFNPELLKNFLTQFLINQDIQIVNLAKLQGPLPEVAGVFEKLKEKEFWERNINDDENIDMKNINFRIGEKQLQGPEIDLARRAFLKCGQSIQQFTVYILQALEEIRNNVAESTENYKFYDNWRKIISRNNFKGSLWNFKSSKSPVHLNKLNHLKYIYQTLQRYEGQQIQMTTKVIHSEIIGIMESFAQYVIMNQEQFNILKQFTFILNRRFEESKVLQKLKKDFVLNNRHSIDILKGFLSNSYKDIQQAYVNQLQKIPGKPREYYQQLILLCDKYEAVIQDIIEKKSFYKNQIANIQRKQNNISAALKLLLQSRQLSESAYSQANSEYYLKVDFNLNKNIAQFLFHTELYEQSLMFYRVIDNTEMIKKCFEKIKKNLKNNAKLFQIYLEQGDYLRQIVQFEKAIQRYKTASDLGVRQEYKKEATNRIVETIKTKKEFLQTFSQRIERKEFYYRLSNKFNEDEVIQKMKHAEKADDIENSSFFVSMRFNIKS